jgi:CDP-diacylglycerol--glycerol-3-phosphate 3-phosphatidyltransferase
VKTLDDALAKNPNLQVTFLLDYLRGTRGKLNSVTMLQPLLSKYRNRIHLHLYHTPNLRGLLKQLLPSRVNEIIGVQHIKLNIFDDNTLITGFFSFFLLSLFFFSFLTINIHSFTTNNRANLSESYFSNRQDRYLWIKNERNVSDYFSKLIDTVSSFSYEVKSDGQLISNSSVDLLKNPTLFKERAREAILPFLDPTASTPMHSGDTFIFPTIQMGVFSIRQDEEVCSFLLQNALPNSQLFITSPYLNLTENYKNCILRSKANVTILTASPKVPSESLSKFFSLQQSFFIFKTGKRILHCKRHFKICTNGILHGGGSVVQRNRSHETTRTNQTDGVRSP